MAEDRKAPVKKAAADKPPAHDVTVTDVPDSYVEQGGTVRAMCTCGWSAHDRYERDRFAAIARTQMRALGAGHTDESRKEARA